MRPWNGLAHCLCISRSAFYAWRTRRAIASMRNAWRCVARSRSRDSAGNRTLVALLRERGLEIGQFNVRRLVREQGLVSKQPDSHRYLQAAAERPDLPNVLDRGFAVPAPNQVWCGDISHIWAQGRWHYLAAVLDLYTRRVVDMAFSPQPDADLVTRTLESAYEQRGRPQGVLFHSDQGGQVFGQRLWRYRMRRA